MRASADCPLCGAGGARRGRTLVVREVAERWRDAFGLDVRDELPDADAIELRACDACGLGFHQPARPGSPALYAALQRFDWYYLAGKWEHEQALSDVRRGDRFLEVGCGPGELIARVRNERDADALGLEINARALEIAARLGRPVSSTPLGELARAEPARFDVVCALEVLEHLPDPAAFFDDAARLLRPGGRLLVAVPDADAFHGDDAENLLDAPPHHLTRWREPTLRAACRDRPLAVLRVAHEPLADYHVEYFTHLTLRRLLGPTPLKRATQRLLRRTLLPLVRKSGLHRLVRGMTIYVAYQRLP